MQKSTIRAFFLLLLLSTEMVIAGCAGHAQPRNPTPEPESERREEGAKLPDPPPKWGGGITVAPVEGHTDTIRFHIGAPLFLSMSIDGDRACEPFNGQPFYFDATGAQLGWGFEEVADSLLFPHGEGRCERNIMLSSENSIRIPEGYYTFKVLIFLDEKSQIYSDTIVLHAVRSKQGADQLSYARFLQEQIIRNSSLLNDPETLRAVFAEGTPQSAESQVYRALILYRGGDLTGADEALQKATQLEKERSRAIAGSALISRRKLEQLIRIALGR